MLSTPRPAPRVALPATERRPLYRSLAGSSLRWVRLPNGTRSFASQAGHSPSARFAYRRFLRCPAFSVSCVTPLRYNQPLLQTGPHRVQNRSRPIVLVRVALPAAERRPLYRSLAGSSLRWVRLPNGTRSFASQAGHSPSARFAYRRFLRCPAFSVSCVTPLRYNQPLLQTGPHRVQCCSRPSVRVRVALPAAERRPLYRSLAGSSLRWVRLPNGTRSFASQAGHSPSARFAYRRFLRCPAFSVSCVTPLRYNQPLLQTGPHRVQCCSRPSVRVRVALPAAERRPLCSRATPTPT